MKFLIGSDPETFIRDTKTKEFVSADGIIPGTKEKPYKVPYGAVQVDGLAAEFNIDPAESAFNFHRNITEVVKVLTEMIKDVNPHYELEFTPYAMFNPEYFEDLPLNSKILGCDPDYNRTGARNNIDETFANQPIRTAAGHIHIGFTEGADPFGEGHFEDCRFIANSFHVNSHFSPKTVDEINRLKYYGANGAFRPKSYGVELRSPSNIWVKEKTTQMRMYERIVGHMNRLAAGAE